MRDFIKNNIKLVIGIIIGLVISGVGVYALTVTAGEISYDNTQSGIQANNVKDAIDKLYEKAENSGGSSGRCPKGFTEQVINDGIYCKPDSSNYSCPVGYTQTIVNGLLYCQDNTKKCHRAETLHTEICNKSGTVGYSIGDTIKYGSLGTVGSEPSPGDAFDCDVNGDGIYNSLTERFYYVSDYFDTSSMTFDTDYATLIYYSNTSSGSPSTSNGVWYCSSQTSKNGPTTAKAQLPTTSKWKNVTLKTTTRNILGGDNPSSLTTTYKSGFSYSGYAARLLTVQELVSACGTTIANSLVRCNWLFEQTNYSTSSFSISGSWLETVYNNNSYIWYVRTSDANAYRQLSYASSSSGNGVRPVIEVPKSQISY